MGFNMCIHAAKACCNQAQAKLLKASMISLHKWQACAFLPERAWALHRLMHAFDSSLSSASANCSCAICMPPLGLAPALAGTLSPPAKLRALLSSALSILSLVVRNSTSRTDALWVSRFLEGVVALALLRAEQGCCFGEPTGGLGLGPALHSSRLQRRFQNQDNLCKSDSKAFVYTLMPSKVPRILISTTATVSPAMATNRNDVVTSSLSEEKALP